MYTVLLACSNPAEPPPPEMEELVWMLLRDFGTSSATPTAELLGAWIDEEIDAAAEGYLLDTPTEDYLVDLTFSAGMELQGMSGAMVIRRVAGDIAAYAGVVPEVDQSFADSSYVRWERTIANGSAAAWPAGSGSLAEAGLLTDDEIEKNAGFGVILPYLMARDYRWIELDRGVGVITRSSIYEEGWADDDNGIRGGFTVELWLPEADGMIWMNATWTDVVSIVDDFADDDFYSNQIIDGSTAVMIGTEAYVTAE